MESGTNPTSNDPAAIEPTDAQKTATPAAPDDRDQLLARIAELEAEQSSSSAVANSEPDAEPQPWQIAAEHGEPEHKLEWDPNTGRPASRPKRYTGPGAVTHTHPILTYGSAGAAVRELAELLAEAGYDDNAVIRGESPADVLDNSVMADVSRFCRDNGVREDVAQFEGLAVPAAKLVESHVGPYIWQALEAAVEAAA